MELRYLLYILLLYFAVRFVIKFVIPVVRVSRQMKQQVRNFQQTMNAHQQPPEGSTTVSGEAPHASPSTPKGGEYIDFEEIK